MLTWLVAAAALSLGTSFNLHVHPNGVQQRTTGDPSASSNFMLPPIRQFSSYLPLQDGMIAEEELAPNAHVGLGLAPMLGRNIHSVRIEQEPVPTKNPGVTFTVKFPG